MDNTISNEFPQVSRQLNLPIAGVQRTVELLEEGNTVPFITRYRKDQTGGLDEEQIRKIDETVTALRQLLERKQTILKSIESQQKMTSELAEQINAAKSLKLLEDLYLPYRPKKQTLATVARQRGLEPLAGEVLDAAAAAGDLHVRAADFVDPEKELPSVDEVLAGVRHLLAERFSEDARLRGRLRKMIWRTGKLVSKKCETAEAKTGEGAEETKQVATEIPADTAPAEVAGQTAAADSATDVGGTDATPPPTPSESADGGVTMPAVATQAPPPGLAAEAQAVEDAAEPVVTEAVESVPDNSSDNSSDNPQPLPPAAPANAASVAGDNASSTSSNAEQRQRRKQARERKKKQLQQSFKDYFEYQEPLGRIPPHRVLAVNRGERAKVLRVKLDVDQEKLRAEAEQLVVPVDHPHADFLRGCVADALPRLILPSLEREIRRELTDKAEAHAVDVFAQNLRKLLLQPPLHGKRVLAIDPGFRSGCKLATLDEFGNLLGHGNIYLIGNEKRRLASRVALLEMIREHNISVIVIGNGTACRETEQLVAELLAEELKDHDVAYVIANEAGASVYSTSDVGREELPDCDATVRGSVSIGRRVLDPLSELVKINPANIGVGLYQHDIKAKPLRDSLNHVVESCVNYVGVDVNTASPALLGYVSGLNQLTARRLYEFRKEHGPFRCREQLREVPGIGEATYVQAAGFLKIIDGDNPLDATWIHPESYSVAQQVLEKTDSNVAELAHRIAHSQPRDASTARDAESMSAAEAPHQEAPADTPPSGEDESGAAASAQQTPLTESSHCEEAADTSHLSLAGDADADVTPATYASLGNDLVERLANADVEVLSQELQVGKLLLQDILVDLARPGRDPREDLPPPIFRRSILKLEDLQPGMELSGTIMNVVDFGAFVDIGLSDSGLIHVSRLADRFVADPHEVVSVGEALKVWVIEVDKQRRRVSLTAIQPGTEKPRESHRGTPADAKQRKPGARPTSPRPARRKTSVSGARQKASKPFTAKRPRQPVVPITQAMAEGDEPMRTFSDLKQFYDKKDDQQPPEQDAQHDEKPTNSAGGGESSARS